MKKNLLKSTFIFSLMTVLSRISGLLRDLVLAHFFGATPGFDVFNVAWRIPNFFRRIFAEGAFSQAFVPILAQYHQQNKKKDIQEFLNNMAGMMLIILLFFTIIAILVTPFLIYIIAPGYINDPNRFNLTIVMLRITFPYILFISLAAYVSGILNTYDRFGIPAFTPTLLNLSLIAATIFLAPYFAQPVKALAWGTFIGGLAQLFFQLPLLCKLKLMPCPRISLKDEGVKKVLKLMAPAILGVSVVPLGLLTDNLIASFLRAGSISWIYYSDRLTSFPLGVFGIAIVTVILPHLSHKYSSQSQEEFSKILDWALKSVFVIAIPATISIAILAGPIITTLFYHGKISEFDVVMIQHSLWGFAIGIPAFMVVKVFASGFYSRQNITTPVKISVISVLTNVVFAIILVFPLKHAGLALATSLASTINAYLLFYTIKKNKHYQAGHDWKTFWLRIIFANMILTLFLFLYSDNLSTWINWTTTNRVWHLAILCSGAVVLYLTCLWASGMRFRDFILKD